MAAHWVLGSGVEVSNASRGRGNDVSYVEAREGD